MSDFDDHIDNFPTGVRWAFAVTISGLPYAWSTQEGLAISGFTSKPGGLCNREFSFDFRAGIKDPFDTGKGIKIELVDDESRYLAKLFAPRHGSSTRQTRELDFSGAYSAGSTGSSLSSSDLSGTLYVKDASIAGVNDYLYLGTETLKVNGTPVTSGDENFPVAREQFMSYQTKHKMSEGAIGSVVSTSPRVFRGRWVEVYAAPVDDSGRPTSFASSDIQKIWAGRVKSISQKGLSYSVATEPLSDVLKDKHPRVLAKGKILSPGDSDAPSVFYHSASSAFQISDGTDTAWLVVKDMAGTLLAPGFYSGTQLASLIHNLINFDTTLDGWTSGNPYKGNVFISYYEYPGTSSDSPQSVFLIENTSSSHIDIKGFFSSTPGGGTPTFFNATLGINYVYVPAKSDEFYEVQPGIPEISGTGGSVIVRLDGDEKFRTTTYRLYDGTPGGASAASFVKLSSNGRTLIASVTGGNDPGGPVGNLQSVTLQPMAIKEDSPWEFFGSGGDVEIEEILLTVLTKDGSIGDFSSGNVDGVGRLLLETLLSTGIKTATGFSGGGSMPSFRKYDTLDYGHGYAIPSRFVDVDGILDAENRCGKFCLWLFYCSKHGSLKKDLKTMLNAAGLRLVTRRFGSEFGISVSPITPPALTSYAKTIDDDFQTLSSTPIVDYNERVIVNLIEATDKTADVLAMAHGVGMEGSLSTYKVRYHLDASQSDYGISDGLNLDMPVVFHESKGASNPSLRLKVHSSAQKWFAAYGYGNYTITITAPHIAWKIQAGDRVRMNLSLLDSNTGDSGITNAVGVIEEVRHKYGSRSDNCLIKIRSFHDYSYEYAPCAKVASSSASGSDTAIVLEANEFSDSTQGAIYEYHAGQSQRDIHWFDRNKHGENIGIFVWAQGAWASGTNMEIISTNVSTNTIVISGQPITPGYSGVYVTLVNYDHASISALSKEYAYVADAAETLGSASDSAKEWIA